MRFRVDARTPRPDLAQVWATANRTRRGWTIRGLVLGPRPANPTTDGQWVAWAQGPEGEAAIEGSGASPEQAVHDLVNRLKSSR